ncbi:hypothetical protein ACN20G_31685 (plasmid) [Streptomyces sp. BI20]|uniref:hypothetical protein n=1 Tax=Streptomyces sp. BI20 TaxID=3403460 RepID=UPI003C774A76
MNNRPPLRPPLGGTRPSRLRLVEPALASTPAPDPTAATLGQGVDPDTDPDTGVDVVPPAPRSENAAAPPASEHPPRSEWWSREDDEADDLCMPLAVCSGLVPGLAIGGAARWLGYPPGVAAMYAFGVGVPVGLVARLLFAVIPGVWVERLVAPVVAAVALVSVASLVLSFTLWVGPFFRGLPTRVDSLVVCAVDPLPCVARIFDGHGGGAIPHPPWPEPRPATLSG